MSEKHLFALYLNQVDIECSNSSMSGISIENSALTHRIGRILRLHPKDEVILFDQKSHAQVIIETIGKTNVTVRLVQLLHNHQNIPTIQVLLPLLKRNHLEQAIYELSALGTNTIQLIKTQKIHPLHNEKKEMVRLHNIIIAAAEQTKNFSFPTLLSPISLENALEKSRGEKIFFDPTGTELFPWIVTARKQKTSQITLLIGPEGDLTIQEKVHVKNANFIAAKLTPTILTAHQAISLATGIIRTLM